MHSSGRPVRPEAEEWGEEESPDIPLRRPPLSTLLLSADARLVSPPSLLGALASRTRSLAGGPSRSLSSLLPSRFNGTSSAAPGLAVSSKSGTFRGLRREERELLQQRSESAVDGPPSNRPQLSEQSESCISVALLKACPTSSSAIPQKSGRSDAPSPRGGPFCGGNLDGAGPERGRTHPHSGGREGLPGCYSSLSGFLVRSGNNSPSTADGSSSSSGTPVSQGESAPDGKKGEDEAGNGGDRWDVSSKVQQNAAANMCSLQSLFSQSGGGERSDGSSDAPTAHIQPNSATSGGITGSFGVQAGGKARTTDGATQVARDRPKQKEGRFSFIQVLAFRSSASGTLPAGSSSSSTATFSTSSTSSLASCCSSLSSARSSPAQGSPFPTPLPILKTSRPLVNSPLGALLRTPKQINQGVDHSNPFQDWRVSAARRQETSALPPSVTPTRESLGKAGRAVFSSRIAKRSRSVEPANAARAVSARVPKRVARASSRGMSQGCAGEANESGDLSTRGVAEILVPKRFENHLEDIPVLQPLGCKTGEAGTKSETLALCPLPAGSLQEEVPDATSPLSTLPDNYQSEGRPFVWLHSVQRNSREDNNSRIDDHRSCLLKGREAVGRLQAATDKETSRGTGRKPAAAGAKAGLQTPTSTFMGLFRSSSAPLQPGSQPHAVLTSERPKFGKTRAEQCRTAIRRAQRFAMLARSDGVVLHAVLALVLPVL